jgi:hypothetical protein
MRPCRIATSGIIIVAVDAFESGCLIYWHGGASLLIPVFFIRTLDVDTEGRELVRSAGEKGRIWGRRRQTVGSHVDWLWK